MKRKTNRNKKTVRKIIRLLILLMMILIAAFAYGARNEQTTIDDFKTHFVLTDENQSKDEWEITLVNRWNPIIEQKSIDIVELSNGKIVDARIYPDLQQMFDDARANGVYMTVVSGYRTNEKQQSIYDNKFTDYKASGMSDKQAKEETERWVALPGTSEHELGLAVDINGDGIKTIGKEAYNWLNKNAYKYGFIYRYPENKTKITGISNEPWHYRYVGKKVANEIRENGMCLEEYVESLVNK